MIKEQITLKKIDGIYDIHPLPIPDLSGFELFLLLVVCFVFIGLVIFFLWHVFLSGKSKIKRQIKQLQSAYSENKVNSHNAAYKLCYLLQQGLKITHIDSTVVLPEKLQTYKQEWDCFADEVSLLRYSDPKNHIENINDLFNKSLFWLRIWP